MRCPGMPPAGGAGAGLSRQRMLSPRWRSDARFVHDDDRAAAITGLIHTLTVHRMGRSCPPNAWRISRAAPIDRDCRHLHDTTENRHDLAAGTASGCMRWLGGTTPEAGVDLPDVLAPEGAAWHDARGRSFRRGWTQRRSHAFLGMAPEGAARDSVPTTTTAGCGARDGA